MDTIRSLLGFMFRVAITLFVVAIVWWLVSTLFPVLKVRSLLSMNGTSTEVRSFLPAPGSLKGLLASPQNTNGNIYTPGEPFDGYGNAYNNNQGGASVDFVTYTTDGKQIIHSSKDSVFNSQQQFAESQKVDSRGYSQKNLFIRNLSIYEGGHVYTGLTFLGEARNTMFQNGKFLIVIVDPMNRVVSTSYAEAITNWTVPGWVKFQVKINSVIPNKVTCTMVFEEARGSYTYETTPPTRVAIPVMCN